MFFGFGAKKGKSSGNGKHEGKGRDSSQGTSRIKHGAQNNQPDQPKAHLDWGRKRITMYCSTHDTRCIAQFDHPVNLVVQAMFWCPVSEHNGDLVVSEDTGHLVINTTKGAEEETWNTVSYRQSLEKNFPQAGISERVRKLDPDVVICEAERNDSVPVYRPYRSQAIRHDRGHGSHQIPSNVSSYRMYRIHYVTEDQPVYDTLSEPSGAQYSQPVAQSPQQDGPWDMHTSGTYTTLAGSEGEDGMPSFAGLLPPANVPTPGMADPYFYPHPEGPATYQTDGSAVPELDAITSEIHELSVEDKGKGRATEAQSVGQSSRPSMGEQSWQFPTDDGAYQQLAAHGTTNPMSLLRFPSTNSSIQHTPSELYPRDGFGSDAGNLAHHSSTSSTFSWSPEHRRRSRRRDAMMLYRDEDVIPHEWQQDSGYA